MCLTESFKCPHCGTPEDEFECELCGLDDGLCTDCHGCSDCDTKDDDG